HRFHLWQEKCSLANWHPHLHLLVTDGGFRADGTFVPLPLHDVTTLTEAFRRAVLRLFVRRELMDVETAHGMLAWPHSGFHVHDGVWVAADDREFAVRLARYSAGQGTNLVKDTGRLTHLYYKEYTLAQKVG
ncbi:MAG: transposase, partial [Acidobacteria bacterium]|nr:transposase [Acidobacteriota bacterium]